MKMLPIYKIPEARSAIADRRIVIDPSSNIVKVKSSNEKKTYAIQWEDQTYVSDDSASYWQGYPGYPVMAICMKQGILSYDDSIAN